MPLLWVLRDLLKLTGTKFGCGIAQCGACTVHVDGVALRSCMLPIGSLGNRQVTTIEAIGATPVGRKVQQAWLEFEVIQCGYCQSGQIMSAAACRWRRPPTRTTPTSTPPWPATSAAAAPMSASAKRSSKRRRRSEAVSLFDRLRPDAAPDSPSRRTVLQVGAALGGGLLIGFLAPVGLAATIGEEDPAGGLKPNAFIRIAPSGRTTLVMPQVEMGQGTYTAIPMILAEELDADWALIDLEHAPPNDALYANPVSASR